MDKTVDKKAIIIGATSGIGLEVARLLHADGWTTGLMGRRTDRLEEIASELGTGAIWQTIDVCSEHAVDDLYKLIDRIGTVDLIFIASGIGKQNHQLDSQIELSTVRTNVEGFTRMITAAYHYFQKVGKGHIAAITSIAGTKGLGTAPAYSATKRYQNCYIQCLAQLAHMQRYTIHFTDIRPGFVDTDLLKGDKYPLLMRPEKVARQIIKALYAKKRKVIINRKYALLVFFWRMIPDWLWERMTIRT